MRQIKALESLGFQIISQFKNALPPLILDCGIFQLSNFFFFFWCMPIDFLVSVSVLTRKRQRWCLRFADFRCYSLMGEMAQNVLNIGGPVFSQCPLRVQLF